MLAGQDSFNMTVNIKGDVHKISEINGTPVYFLTHRAWNESNTCIETFDPVNLFQTSGPLLTFLYLVTQGAQTPIGLLPPKAYSNLGYAQAGPSAVVMLADAHYTKKTSKRFEKYVHLRDPWLLSEIKLNLLKVENEFNAEGDIRWTVSTPSGGCIESGEHLADAVARCVIAKRLHGRKIPVPRGVTGATFDNDYFPSSPA